MKFKLLLVSLILLLPTQTTAITFEMSGDINYEEKQEQLLEKQWNDLENARLLTHRLKQYPKGQCTAYVSSKRNIPAWWGNAGQWFSHAQKTSYYETGNIPEVGATFVTWEGDVGHAGQVIDIKENSFIIEEENYVGWNQISQREIQNDFPLLQGFIYKMSAPK